MGRPFLPLIAALTGLGILGFGLITPVLPDLATAMGVSRGSVGIIQGAAPLPGVFLAVYMGYLADRHGRRAVLSWSLAIYGLAGGACFLVRSFWPLVVLRTAQGVGISGVLSLPLVLIGDLFPPAHRRWVLGVNGAALTVTAALAPALGGLLAVGDPFRPFLLYLLALAFIPWVLRLPPHPRDAALRPMAHLADALRALRARGALVDFLGLAPFSTLVVGLFVGLGLVVTALFLEAEFGVSVARRGLIQAAVSVGSTAGALTSARVAARLGAGPTISAGLGVTGVGFLLFGTAPGIPAVLVAEVSIGYGLGVFLPVIQDFVTSVTDRHRATLVGIWISAIRAGQFAGPVVGAALAHALGERAAYLIGAGVLLLLPLAWPRLRTMGRGRG